MGDNRLEPLVLSDAERRTLQGWARRRATAQGLALRARIVLACAEGRSNIAVPHIMRGQLPQRRMASEFQYWLEDVPVLRDRGSGPAIEPVAEPVIDSLAPE